MQKKQQPNILQSQQRQKQSAQVDNELKARIQEGLRKKKQLDAKALQTGMSKNQLKKLQKKQKWEEDKLIKRKQKRSKQREKKKQNKQKQSQNTDNNVHVQAVIDHTKPQQLMKKRKDEYQQKMQDNLKVVIDMQFYDQMTQKELNSLVKQLSYCHAVNRKMEKPFHYILTSLTEERQKFLDEKYNGNKWGIRLFPQSLTQAFNNKDLVYLTGDAEQQIQQFDQNKIYVIGGIVDHNRLKNITYDFAKNHNIQVKRLPFNNIKLKTNVHLAVNHVWEWMLRKYNGESWDTSLSKVLPERKIQKVTIQ